MTLLNLLLRLCDGLGALKPYLYTTQCLWELATVSPSHRAIGHRLAILRDVNVMDGKSENKMTSSEPLNPQLRV